MRSNRRFAFLCYFALASLFLSLCSRGVSAQDGEAWSGWHNTDGEGRIQYRWRTYGGGVIVPKCDYQLRNLSSSDTNTYDSTVDYIDPQGKDGTKDGPLLDETYTQNNGGIFACTKVTDVMTKIRRR